MIAKVCIVSDILGLHTAAYRHNVCGVLEIEARYRLQSPD